MTEKRFRTGKSILTDFPTDAIIDEKTGERYYDGIKPSYISSKELVKILNELNEENIKLQNSLKEFDVFESNRINGAVVTNDDFSVSLHSNNEAYIVCNMLNRFIRSVKDGNKD